MNMFGHSVCIGKFLPPHHGHKLLVETALASSTQVTIIICDKVSDPIPGLLRAAWLREIHPTAEVMRIDDIYDSDDDSALWARLTIQWLGHVPDAVFTSEPYGDAYARAMGCVHVLVDGARLHVPCSGTAIRRNPFRNWHFLDPPARGYFARRVCVLGAESTGTTTLADALAERLETVRVEEYGREYSARKQRRGEAVWATEEFLHIAREQARREDLAARAANRVLICDTNAFATSIWHRRYLGAHNPEVDRLGAASRCDLYILTGDEIPFVQDGLRDGEAIRHEMHQWFVKALTRQIVPWKLVFGSLERRLAMAVDEIERVTNALA